MSKFTKSLLLLNSCSTPEASFTTYLRGNAYSPLLVKESSFRLKISFLLNASKSASGSVPSTPAGARVLPLSTALSSRTKATLSPDGSS